MDFTVLKYFQAVARNGNMTKTARELYITQPNLSKRIAQLEEEIGVPLFEHRKGKIVLNDYGRIFLSSVDIAFAELKAGMENVQRTYTLNQNILSLGSNILHYLAIRLPRFSEAHPEIGIRQHFSHRINVIFQTDSETVLYIRQYFVQGTGKFRLVCLRLGFGRKRCGKKHSKKDSFHLFLIYVSCFFTTDTTDFHRFIIFII